MALKPVGGKYEGVWINELKNGDISFYINYRDETGEPRKDLVGKKTASSDFTARDAYSKLIEVKYKLQHDQEPSIKGGRVTKIKLDELWDKYLLWAKNNKKTWDDDLSRYNNHIKPNFGSKAVKSLSSLDFENLKQDLYKKNLSASTIKHCLAIVRQIFNYAIKNDFIKNITNPVGAGRVKMPQLDNTRIAFLTKQESKELIDILYVTNKGTYYLVLILLFTGARFSEVATLTWSHVNFNTNTIFFKKTKRGNERHIIMSSQLLTAMKELKTIAKEQKSEFVIRKESGLAYTGMPLHFGSAMEAIISGNRQKDIKYKITAHSLRHTHASWLAESGLDILQIKEQLGHKTIEMTMRYAHLIPNRRHEATQNLYI